MILTIMQPYLFPYIGYWQLINAVDTFVIYDDVNFIKKGYINRNSILNIDTTQRFTLELMRISQNKLINQIQIGGNRKKLLKSIELAYKKAPEYEKVFPLIKTIIEYPEENLAKFIGHSLKHISEYIGIQTNFIFSSDINKDNNLKGQDKILAICQHVKASHYINAIHGQNLYDKETFMHNRIKLNFIETELIEYRQFNNKFVPYLSIIDIMMFNTKNDIIHMLRKYKLK